MSSARSGLAAGDAGLLAVLASMWGCSFLFIKVAVDVFPPLWIVAGRTAIGSVVLLVIMRLSGRRLPRDRRLWRDLAILAVLNNVIPWTMLAWGEQTVPSGLAAVANALTPAVTFTVAATIGLERFTAMKAVGLSLALAGTVLAVSPELAVPGRALPVLAVVLPDLFYASAAVYAKRRVSHREAPLVIASGQIVSASLLSLPLALLGPPPLWRAASPATLGSLTALGVLGTGLAFVVFYMLIARVGATGALLVTYLIPVVGLLAGWLVLGESLGPQVPLGAAIVVAGIWLGQRERKVRDPVPAVEEAAT